MFKLIEIERLLFVDEKDKKVFWKKKSRFLAFLARKSISHITDFHPWVVLLEVCRRERSRHFVVDLWFGRERSV